MPATLSRLVPPSSFRSTSLDPLRQSAACGKFAGEMADLEGMTNGLIWSLVQSWMPASFAFSKVNRFERGSAVCLSGF